MRGRVRRRLRAGAERIVPPAWGGYRWVRRETVREHLRRRGDAGGTIEAVHPPDVAHHPLPVGVASRDELPADAGWWGYSFRDVPARRSGETFVATLPDVRVVCYRDPDRDDDFFPALLADDDRALDLRELRFRPRHAEVLRRSGPPVERERATWVLERVYHNHSHWITAHLPKIVLLRDRGQLDDVLLPPPADRTATMDGSLRMLGLDPDRFGTFDPTRPLRVGSLTVIGSDRFRPELLRMVQAAFAPPAAPPPGRRVFISRQGAGRRRLVNEDEVWPILAGAGFERVRMEELTFDEQVGLMRSTAVLVAPHGAGLTNVMFCSSAPGIDVVEIADLGFPNPNFYALTAALGHRYHLVGGEAVGAGHPLDRDLRVDPAALARVLTDLA